MYTYQVRVSLRGLERIFGVSHQTVLRWLKARAQELPELKGALLPARLDDVLELDELWSFVLKKTQNGGSGQLSDAARVSLWLL